MQNPPPSVSKSLPTKVLFVEIFAGQGRLSLAVGRLGVPTFPPQDLSSSGFDMSCDAGVRELWALWSGLGYHIPARVSLRATMRHIFTGMGQK